MDGKAAVQKLPNLKTAGDNVLECSNVKVMKEVLNKRNISARVLNPGANRNQTHKTIQFEGIQCLERRGNF